MDTTSTEVSRALSKPSLGEFRQQPKMVLACRTTTTEMDVRGDGES